MRVSSLLLVVSLLAAVAPPVHAETAPPAGDLETAKELFRQGVTLFEAGDIEHALSFFMRSRAAYPSAKNTLNAAICLEKLGRADEALELYEEVVTKFGDGIDPAARAGVVSAAANLRKKVGNVDVSANVEGTLVIDGRMRGKLPLLAPVRVMPGTHVVRVIKDGWDSFQTTVKVEVGQTTTVDAKLAPLTASGKLRVEGLEGATVFVDGASVGTVPWEGTLSPGPHLCFVQKDDRGSDPRVVQVIKSQVNTITIDPKPLGTAVTIVVEPATAQLSVDNTPLGAGRWQGRLTTGAHSFTAREEGYVTGTLAIQSGDKAGGEQVLRLVVDRDHPRWAVAKAAGHFLVELGGGPLLGSGLGSDAEVTGAGDAALGLLAQLRVGYELPARLSLIVGGGYLRASRTVDRTVSTAFPGKSGPVPIDYVLHDELSVSGPLATFGVGYRAPVSMFDFGARLAVGVAFVGARDAMTGEARSGGRAIPLDIEASGRTVRAVSVLAMPELWAGLRLGNFGVHLAVAAVASLSNGPRLDTGQTFVQKGACVADSVECAPSTRIVANERAFGRFLLVSPTLAFSWTF